MKAPVIEVRDLEPNGGANGGVRGGVRDAAPAGVTFTVASGEVYAVLGRYGAGKTTLLELLAGLRRPTAGTVRVHGADPYADRDAARSGAVWRDGGLFPGLTVAEVVDTWRRWTLDPLTRADALDRVGLAAAADVPFERLGQGERRRLDLALALVGRSDLLLLDEPTAGLDTGPAREVRSVLRRLAAHGTTIVLTTRDPDEACRADRVGVLDEGRLLTVRDSERLPARLRAA